MQRKWKPGLHTDYEDETTSPKPALTNCVDLSSSAIKVALNVAKTK